MSKTFKDKFDDFDWDAYEERQRDKREAKEVAPYKWWLDELEPSLTDDSSYF